MATIASWNTLTSFPFTHLSQPFATNNHEFVVASDKNNDCNGDGIYKFSTHKNEWIKIFDYDTNFTCNFWSSAYNSECKLLYVCATSKMLTFDLNTESKMTKEEQNEAYFGLIFAENKLHKICSKGGDHYIYDETKQFKKITTLGSLDDVDDYGLIHLKSRKSILLFGGSQVFNCYDSIYEFSCVGNSKWRELNIKMPKQLSDFGLIKTKNEQYIIILGGYTNVLERTDNIFIYDVRNNLFIESKIKCPTKGPHHAIMMNNSKRNELTSFGFVNDCYKREHFIGMQLLPQYLIKMICCYYCNEEIYLLKRTGKHWKINVDYILQ